MGKRYTKPLSEHIRIADEHATYLVKHLAVLANKAKRLQAKNKLVEAEELYTKMYLITEELKPVVHWVKENWPQIAELYDVIQSVKVEHEVN